MTEKIIFGVIKEKEYMDFIKKPRPKSPINGKIHKEKINNLNKIFNRR